jgi:glycosyltransferase involved in cell wall biosynthesis
MVAFQQQHFVSIVTDVLTHLCPGQNSLGMKETSINKCIFIFGYGRFDQQFESVSFILAKEFAKNNNKVFYIDYPFTTRDALRAKNSESYKMREKAFKGINHGIIETQIPNLKIVVVPPLWSLHFLPEGNLYRWLLKRNEKVIAKTINGIIESEKIQDFIYINSWVFHYPNVAKYLNPILRIYHCIDPLVMDYDVKHGIISEKQLIQNSDMVICTSKQLQDEKKKLHPKTYFVSNAADIKHSILATEKSLEEHPNMLAFKKPVIGFFGSIEKRIDYIMMKEVAEKNPDKSFVFAGPVSKEWVPDYFSSLPNVHFIGRIPYDEMPSVLKAFNVAIIPFRKYEDSATVFPMKLFEYLGGGKPVVSTDFNPDLKNFTDDLVAYCSNAQQFSNAINEALYNDNESLQQERIKLAGEHTWESRAAEIERLIESAQPLKQVHQEVQ